MMSALGQSGKGREGGASAQGWDARSRLAEGWDKGRGGVTKEAALEGGGGRERERRAECVWELVRQWTPPAAGVRCLRGRECQPSSPEFCPKSDHKLRWF